MSDRPLSSRAQKMFAVIEAYQASGLTQKAFCQSEGLAFSTFQYWLSRYRREHRPDFQQSSPDGLSGFVELKPQTPLPSGHIGDRSVVVSYPSGVVVSLGATVDLALLKELIAL